MKRLLYVFVALMIVALLLPGGALAQKKEITVDKPFATPSLSNKMEFEVTDFETWVTAYKADEPKRKAEGMIEDKVLKGEMDSKVVIVIQVWPTKTKYEAYEAKLDPEWLKKYGLTAKPSVTWYDTIVTTGPKP